MSARRCEKHDLPSCLGCHPEDCVGPDGLSIVGNLPSSSWLPRSYAHDGEPNANDERLAARNEAVIKIVASDGIPEGMALLLHPCGCEGDRVAHEADAEHMAKRHAVLVKGLAK
jgi:hypothetical protein